MSERELNRAVAHATGETIETIQRCGFQIPEAERLGTDPLIIDWDRGAPGSLSDVLSDHDWPGRTDPLPSYDEEFDEDQACAAA